VPTRPGHPCAEPGCPVITNEARCPAHRKSKDTKTADEAAFYNSRRWRNYRVGYLKRHPLCVACSREGVVALAKIVDHVVAMRDGGAPWDESNHQGLCMTHHQRKRQAEGQARRTNG
jgi:5-methylcytosine-specific restriction protein A